MKIDKNRFREWLVEFRFTLIRGYGWLQVPLLGFIFVGVFKTAFPGLIDSFTKFVVLGILGFVAIWVAGVIDKKYRFLHEEMNYSMRVNPLMMKVIDNVPNQQQQQQQLNQEVK